MLEAGYKYFWNGIQAEFYTAYGASYAVSFLPAKGYFSNKDVDENVFRLDLIQKDPGPNNVPDYRIGITVAEILYDFFDANRSRVIFYICDPVDGKGKVRLRKFDHWKQLFGNNDFTSISISINNSSLNCDVVFITKTRNRLTATLLEEINRMKDDISRK